MALAYNMLSEELQNRIISDRKEHWENPCKFPDEKIVRRRADTDKPNLWRPAFVRDTEKILHLPVYNRYADKTQVFSFYRNDDITRRALHVQLVSRIARNIGSVLGLNQDLIEAISLGHDIGHTPFGHAGESYLSELLHNETGRYFNHNVHSTRVLDVIFRRNISLQTLDGILCHNGELEQQEYRPKANLDFIEYDRENEACCVEGKPAIERLVPSTLEGCVVRISDMIAYLGKDRQDAVTAGIISGTAKFSSEEIGTENATIINNLIVDIIENSYRKEFISLSEKAFRDLTTAKNENYRLIYKCEAVSSVNENTIKPMMRDVYYRILDDLKKEDKNSFVYRHHIKYITDNIRHYDEEFRYETENPNQIAVDYIASMTDDYFIDLHRLLFPDSAYRAEYISYFDESNQPRT